MNLKKISALFYLFTQVVLINAQVDTLFYTSFWSETVKERAEYFRPKPVENDELFLVKDYFISGQLQMLAQSFSMDEDVFEGEVKWYYKSGAIKKTAVYKNGLIDGYVCQYDSLGQLLAKCMYKENQPYNGVCMVEHANLAVYEFFKDGQFLSKETTDLNAHGKAKVILERADDHYQLMIYNIKGEFVGKGIFDKEGKRKNGIFADLMTSPMQIASLEYVTAGEVDSVCFYYRNGQIKQVTKGEGDTKLDTFFDQSGKRIGTLTYKGRFPYEGIKVQFNNILSGFCDNMACYESYQNGFAHGRFVDYHLNGQPREVGQYVKGNKDGLFKYYDEQGNLFCEGHFKMGKKNNGEFGSYLNSLDKEVYENGAFKEGFVHHENGLLQEHVFKDSLRLYYDKQGNEIARSIDKSNRPYDGVAVEYRDNGDVYGKLFYKNGHVYKEQEFRREEACLKEERYYKDRRLIKKIAYYSSGEVFAEIEYLDTNYEKWTYYSELGKVIGFFERKNYVKNGDQYDFDNGVIDNIIRYKNDTIVYKKQFTGGGNVLYEEDFDGQAKYYNNWGNLIAQGIYRNGQAYDGVFYTYNRSLHIENIFCMKDGVKEGYSKGFKWNERLNKNELIFEANFSNGKINGIYKNYWEEKLLQTIPYENGVKEGEAIFYDAEGNEISRGVYKQGEKYEGTFYSYTNNVIREKESYLNGKAHGDKYTYDYTGKPVYVVSYQEGIVLVEKHYFDGKEYVLTYKNNKKWQGIQTQGQKLYFYEKGGLIKYEKYKTESLEKLDYSIVYKSENPEITQETQYDLNGNMQRVFSYKDGIKDGKAIYYNVKGEVEAKGVFNMGIPVSGKFIFNHRYLPSFSVYIEIVDKQMTATVMDDEIKETAYQLTKNKDIGEEEWREEIVKFLISLERMLDYKYNLI
jgi:antitoxin component YwqK of YwqJK toxin-antitoxin module